MDILPVAYFPLKNSFNDIVRLDPNNKLKKSKNNKIKIKGVRYLKKYT